MAENNIEKNSNIEKINEDTVSESKVAGNSEKQEKPKTTKTTTHKSGAKKSTTTSKTKKSSKENSSTAKKTSSSRVGKNTKKEIAIEEPVKANTKTKSKTTKKGASKTNTTKKTTTPTEKKTNAKKTTKSGNTNKVEKSKAVKKSKKTDDRIKQIINEQLNNVDKFEEVKEVPAKKKKDKKKIDEKQIEEQIETAKKMPKDEKKKIYKKVFANIILGIVVTLYFIGIGIGFLNIDGPTFITDLKVFSLSILAIAIILFEFAYGKDDDKTALYGVEMLFVAIMSLVLLYTCILHKDKFIAVANIVACIGVLYYLVKSISIYIREKLKWKKTISDVKEIVAEE
ncbi:MAG: hypothetical protein ACLVAK_06220 [Clostridia bacterium]